MHYGNKGVYPFAFPFPPWYLERIYLRGAQDPCPSGWKTSKITGKCVYVPRALRGLDGVLDDPFNIVLAVGAGILGYFLGRRK